MRKRITLLVLLVFTTTTVLAQDYRSRRTRRPRRPPAEEPATPREETRPSRDDSGRSSPDDSIEAFMRVHNQARAEVGAPPLKWSQDLADHARQWAEQLASEGGNRIRHRPQNRHGENLAWGTSMDGETAARMWLGEKSDYDGGPISRSNFQGVGHYTQMIWGDTRQVGFARVRAGGSYIVVANYSPAGNIIGRKP